MTFIVSLLLIYLSYLICLCIFTLWHILFTFKVYLNRPMSVERYEYFIDNFCFAMKERALFIYSTNIYDIIERYKDELNETN